jgi:hypothetical protein
MIFIKKNIMDKLILEEIQRMTLLSKYDNSKTLSEQGSLEYQAAVQAGKNLGELKKYYETTNQKPADTKVSGEQAVVINNPNSKIYFTKNRWFQYTKDGKTITNYGNWSMQNGKPVLTSDLKKTTQVDPTKTGPTDVQVTDCQNFPFKLGCKNPILKKLQSCLGMDAASQNGVLDENTMSNLGKRIQEIMFPKGELGISSGANIVTDRIRKEGITQKDYDLFIQNCKGGTKKQSIPIPLQLKDTEGIKAFQDWLDINAKGWATGYKDGILNKGQNGGGYGSFGPRTQKAWNIYKDKYLQEVGPQALNSKQSTLPVQTQGPEKTSTPANQQTTVTSANPPTNDEQITLTPR